MADLRPLLILEAASGDTLYRDRLLLHLNVIKNQGYIDVWHDEQVQAGSDRESERARVLGLAHGVIILISAEYLNSSAFRDLPAMLKRAQCDTFTVLPILARPCDWKAIPFLRTIEMRPADGLALSQRELASLDETLHTIVRELRIGVRGAPFDEKDPKSSRDPANPPESSFTQDRAVQLARIHADLIYRCLFLGVLGTVVVALFGTVAVVIVTLAFAGTISSSLRRALLLRHLLHNAAPLSAPTSSGSTVGVGSVGLGGIVARCFGILGLTLGTGWVLHQQPSTGGDAQPGEPPDSHTGFTGGARGDSQFQHPPDDSYLLAEARQLFQSGDIEAAHSQLSHILDPAALNDPVVYLIETAWARMVLERAANTEDTDRKRRLLARIPPNTNVDQQVRQEALDLLAALPDPTLPGPTLSDPNPTAPSVAVSQASDPRVAVNPSGIDESAIRRGLEVKVWGGKASIDEVRMLKAICSHQGDRACRDRAAAILQQRLSHPQNEPQ